MSAVEFYSRFISHSVIPDLSQWKEHDQFEASFARLLKDLMADEPGR